MSRRRRGACPRHTCVAQRYVQNLRPTTVHSLLLFILHSCAKTRTFRLAVAACTMVEGHSVHRIAASHTRRLVGLRFKASSPNGRFTEGAKQIDGREFRRIEAIGKNVSLFRSSRRSQCKLAVVHAPSQHRSSSPSSPLLASRMSWCTSTLGCLAAGR